MTRSDHLAADLCLKAQQDNALGKLCWVWAKAICNTQCEPEETLEGGRSQRFGQKAYTFFFH